MMEGGGILMEFWFMGGSERGLLWVHVCLGVCLGVVGWLIGVLSRSFIAISNKL